MPTLGEQYSEELEMEAPACRKCIERVPESLYEYKPHEKSMKMGDLVFIVAEIPKWISHMIASSDIDFATFTHEKPAHAADMAAQFDKNMAGAKKALEHVSDEALVEPFSLKMNGKVLFTSPKKDNISSSINHLVHHRGQLTVYMRLNDIAVPSIYGPSADDRTFDR